LDVDHVKGYLGRGNTSGVRLLSAANGQNGHTENGQRRQSEQKTYGKKVRVRAYLDANSRSEQLSINQVRATLKDAVIKAGRTTVAEVLQERKQMV
jgi:hypothetical protein